MLTNNFDCSSVVAFASLITGYSARELVGPNRRSDLVLPRHVSMWAAVKAGAGYAGAARHFQKHHTTVIYAFRKVEASFDARVVFLRERVLEALPDLAKALEEEAPRVVERKRQAREASRLRTVVLNQDERLWRRQCRRQNEVFCAVMAASGEWPS